MHNSAVTFFQMVRGGLIVSCQALPDEPLHSPQIMARMAVAAQQGGAVGIRANTVADIQEIKKAVHLPVIGIIKQIYSDFPDVYITPSMSEINLLAACGAEVIAMDATDRLRHGGLTLRDLFREARARYPEQLFMADCSCIEEGMDAADMGFDLIGTTMAGYTLRSADTPVPPFQMIRISGNTLRKTRCRRGAYLDPGGARARNFLRRADSCGRDSNHTSP